MKLYRVKRIRNWLSPISPFLAVKMPSVEPNPDRLHLWIALTPTGFKKLHLYDNEVEEMVEV